MKGRGEAADEIYEENLVGGEKRRKKKTWRMERKREREQEVQSTGVGRLRENMGGDEEELKKKNCFCRNPGHLVRWNYISDAHTSPHAPVSSTHSTGWDGLCVCLCECVYTFACDYCEHSKRGFDLFKFLPKSKNLTHTQHLFGPVPSCSQVFTAQWNMWGGRSNCSEGGGKKDIKRAGGA